MSLCVKNATIVFLDTIQWKIVKQNVCQKLLYEIAVVFLISYHVSINSYCVDQMTVSSTKFFCRNKFSLWRKNLWRSWPLPHPPKRLVFTASFITFSYFFIDIIEKYYSQNRKVDTNLSVNNSDTNPDKIIRSARQNLDCCILKYTF